MCICIVCAVTPDILHIAKLTYTIDKEKVERLRYNESVKNCMKENAVHFDSNT